MKRNVGRGIETIDRSRYGYSGWDHKGAAGTENLIEMQTFNETDKVQRSEVKRKEGLTNESYNSLTPHPLHPHPPIAPRSNDLDMKTQRKSPSIPGRPADVLSPVNGDKSDRDSFNKDNGKSQSTSKHGNLLQERKIGETPIR